MELHSMSGYGTILQCVVAMCQGGIRLDAVRTRLYKKGSTDMPLSYLTRLGLSVVLLDPQGHVLHMERSWSNTYRVWVFFVREHGQYAVYGQPVERDACAALRPLLDDCLRCEELGAIFLDQVHLAPPLCPFVALPSCAGSNEACRDETAPHTENDAHERERNDHEKEIARLRQRELLEKEKHDDHIRLIEAQAVERERLVRERETELTKALARLAERDVAARSIDDTHVNTAVAQERERLRREHELAMWEHDNVVRELRLDIDRLRSDLSMRDKEHAMEMREAAQAHQEEAHANELRVQAREEAHANELRTLALAHQEACETLRSEAHAKELRTVALAHQKACETLQSEAQAREEAHANELRTLAQAHQEACETLRSEAQAREAALRQSLEAEIADLRADLQCEALALERAQEAVEREQEVRQMQMDAWKLEEQKALEAWRDDEVRVLRDEASRLATLREEGMQWLKMERKRLEMEQEKEQERLEKQLQSLRQEQAQLDQVLAVITEERKSIKVERELLMSERNHLAEERELTGGEKMDWVAKERERLIETTQGLEDLTDKERWDRVEATIAHQSGRLDELDMQRLEAMEAIAQNTDPVHSVDHGSLASSTAGSMGSVGVPPCPDLDSTLQKLMTKTGYNKEKVEDVRHELSVANLEEARMSRNGNINNNRRRSVRSSKSVGRSVAFNTGEKRERRRSLQPVLRRAKLQTKPNKPLSYVETVAHIKSKPTTKYHI